MMSRWRNNNNNAHNHAQNGKKDDSSEAAATPPVNPYLAARSKLRRSVAVLPASDIPTLRDAVQNERNNAAAKKSSSNSITLQVKTPSKSFSLTVEPRNIISEVKVLIEAQDNTLPTREQKLLFNGKELRNITSVGECRLKDGSQLEVQKAVGFGAARRSPSMQAASGGESLFGSAEKQPRASFVRPKPLIGGKSNSFRAAASSDDDGGNDQQVDDTPKQLNVKLPSGKSAELEVDATSTVADLKDMIEINEGIAAKKQRLVLDGRELRSNTQTLESCNLTAQSVLEVREVSGGSAHGAPFAARRAQPVNVFASQEGKGNAGGSNPFLAGRGGLRQSNHGLGGNSWHAEKREAASSGSKKNPYLAARAGFRKSSMSEVPVVAGGDASGPAAATERNKAKFRISVKVDKNGGEHSVSLNVDHSTTMAEVKLMLEAAEGISTKEQSLVFEGKELRNTNTVGECRISADSILEVHRGTPPPGALRQKPSWQSKRAQSMSVFGATRSNGAASRERPAYLRRNTTSKRPEDIGPIIADDGESSKPQFTAARRQLKQSTPVKRVIPKAEMIEQVELRHLISVKMPNGRTIGLDVGDNDTIAEVKGMITTKTNEGVTAADTSECKRLEYRGRELQDNRRVHDYDIKNGAMLKAYIEARANLRRAVTLKHAIPETRVEAVKLRKTSISVRTPKGQSIGFDVNGSDTIASLKERLRGEEGMDSPEDVSLTHKGAALADDSTIEENGVVDGSTLHVEPLRQISIMVKNKLTDRVLKIQLPHNATVGELKRKIRKSGCAIRPEKQLVMLDGKRLEADDRSIADYDIRDGSALTVEPLKIPILVKNKSAGKTIPLDVEPEFCIKSIKEKIEQDPEGGIPVSKQWLTYYGECLEPDEATVEDFGIAADSTLVLESCSMQIEVQMMDGSVLKKDVAPSSPVKSLVESIAKEEQIAPNVIRLYCDGKELAKDAGSLSDCKVVNGSKIIVESQSVPVRVKMPDGKLVEPGDTISDLKDGIAARGVGPPPQDQGLFLSGEPLDDDRAIEGYGIGNGSGIVELRPFTIHVFVETPAETRFGIDVEPSTKLVEVKDIIAETEGVAPERQCLTFAGQELLKDNSTLADYNIRDGSTIHVETYTIQIKVNTPAGTTLDLQVEPCDTIDEVKQMIEEAEDVPVGRQRLIFAGDVLAQGDKTLSDYRIFCGSVLDVEPFTITVFVDTPLKNRLEVMVEPCDTLEELKQSIEEETAIAASRQELIFNGEKLDDDGLTLAEYKVHDKSTLQLLAADKVAIKVKTASGILSFCVDPSLTTTEVLKKLVSSATEAPPDDFDLVLEGGVLQGAATLGNSGVKDGSLIEMDSRRMQISVMTPPGDVMRFTVDPQATVDDIKELVAEEEQVPVERQRLLHNGQELSDGSRRLRDCGIESGAVLDVEPFTIAIEVRTPAGSSIPLEIEPNNSIDDVKAMIADAEGVSPERQCLYLNGKKLRHGERVVSDYDITPDSVLEVEIYTIPISVVTPDGRTLDLQVEPNDTVNTVKEMICEVEEVDPKRQCISWEGDDLVEGHYTLADYGIGKGSILEVGPLTIPITVEAGGQIIELDVEGCDTADDLLEMVADMASIASSRREGQRLTMSGIVLRDGSRQLADYGIEKGSILHLGPKVGENSAAAKSPPRDENSGARGAIQKGSILQVGSKMCENSVSVVSELTNPSDDYSLNSRGDFSGPILHLGPNLCDNSVSAVSALTPALDDDHSYLSRGDISTLPDEKSAMLRDSVNGGHFDFDGDRPDESRWIPISVRMPTGEPVSLAVHCDDTVEKIIASLAGDDAAPEEFKLLLDNDELDSLQLTVEECGIERSSKLELEPAAMQITLAAEGGVQVPLGILPFETVGSIKLKIANSVGIPEEDQMLLLDDTELCKDDATATDCGINKLSSLRVDRRWIPVRLSLPSGGELPLEVAPSESIEEIMSMVASGAGLPPDDLKLTWNGVELEDIHLKAKDYGIEKDSLIRVDAKPLAVTVSSPDGETNPFEVQPFETIGSIKTRLSKNGEELRLFHGEHELNDESLAVNECSIDPGAKLRVEPRWVSLEVQQPDGSKLSLAVGSDYTPGQVLSAIALQIGAAPDEIDLFRNGKEWSDAAIKVRDCCFGADSNISFSRRQAETFPAETGSMSIIVIVPRGQKITLSVDPTHSIDDVKTRLATRESIPTAEQRILFKAKDVTNSGGSTLQSCGIQDGSTITMKEKTFPIYVNTPSGRQTELFLVKATRTSVEEVKAMIEDADGIVPEKQCLRFEGEELIDGRIMADYGITRGAVLDVERRKREIMSSPVAQFSTPADEPKTSTLSIAERRKKCYMWYARLGCPTRRVMKEKVVSLPEACELTPDDVDLLPWGRGGFNLNVHKMNQLFENPEDIPS